MNLKNLIFFGIIFFLIYHILIIEPHIEIRIKLHHAFLSVIFKLSGIRTLEKHEPVVFHRNFLETLANLVSVAPQPEFKDGFRSQDVSVTFENRTNGLVRIYEPDVPQKKLPVLVWIHGGGFALNHIWDRNTEVICQMFLKYGHFIVISVEYRLAPEYPFPAAVDDCETVFLWLEKISKDEKLLKKYPLLRKASFKHTFVGGDSAGGNLAIVSSILFNEKFLTSNQSLHINDPNPSLQLIGLLLYYPALFMVPSPPSLKLFEDAYIIPRPYTDWFLDSYLSKNKTLMKDPRVNPLLSPNINLVPPGIVIVADYDPLYDEGKAFFQKMQELNIDYQFISLPTSHGFITLAHGSGYSKHSIVQCLGVARNLLTKTGFYN